MRTHNVTACATARPGPRARPHARGPLPGTAGPRRHTGPDGLGRDRARCVASGPCKPGNRPRARTAGTRARTPAQAPHALRPRRPRDQYAHAGPTNAMAAPFSLVSTLRDLARMSNLELTLSATSHSQGPSLARPQCSSMALRLRKAAQWRSMARSSVATERGSTCPLTCEAGGGGIPVGCQRVASSS